ncbi:hybrid sensor histidine kinase/response regulator [Candidatus Parabeggiatoa sp. HSG14]|uniref:hybrid sensor histidine kinase/response regulator n=1 Tax=Candidatus Parabeggiatoa sp. HSG14 TaxID=3055593 RepID=UPI0025A89CDA|nr:hybrid sensor histidine kinase/response regulator [Thiotrichales bacterium HSG14]
MNKNQKPLILIVDDNTHNLQVLGSVLKKNNYSPALAQNGAGALDFVKKKLPALILLDIMMPEMDGFAVCKKLKQETATKEIPVIFLSARSEKEDIIKGLELGAVDYVSKPFNLKELIARVQTHIELKTAKEALNQKIEELKQANASKDKFFSIIAHDLINPFNSLIGLLELLAHQNEQLSEEDKDKFIQIILNSSKKSYDLLKNLLEWSRAQTGRIKVNPVTFNLKEMIDRNIELLEHQASAKNINLFSYIEANSVFADEQMLDTVIRNLLSNAVKFTPINGKVSILSKKRGNEVEISISDTGVGIEDIDKLFRIDVTYTTEGTEKEKGSGLGLILCKEFVEKNRGSIWVESEKGKGSIFHINLPFL